MLAARPDRFVEVRACRATCSPGRSAFAEEARTRRPFQCLIRRRHFLGSRNVRLESARRVAESAAATPHPQGRAPELLDSGCRPLSFRLAFRSRPRRTIGIDVRRALRVLAFELCNPLQRGPALLVDAQHRRSPGPPMTRRNRLALRVRGCGLPVPGPRPPVSPAVARVVAGSALSGRRIGVARSVSTRRSGRSAVSSGAPVDGSVGRLDVGRAAAGTWLVLVPLAVGLHRAEPSSDRGAVLVRNGHGVRPLIGRVVAVGDGLVAALGDDGEVLLDRLVPAQDRIVARNGEVTAPTARIALLGKSCPRRWVDRM